MCRVELERFSQDGQVWPVFSFMGVAGEYSDLRLLQITPFLYLVESLLDIIKDVMIRYAEYNFSLHLRLT